MPEEVASRTVGPKVVSGFRIGVGDPSAVRFGNFRTSRVRAVGKALRSRGLVVPLEKDSFVAGNHGRIFSFGDELPDSRFEVHDVRFLSRIPVRIGRGSSEFRIGGRPDGRRNRREARQCGECRDAGVFDDVHIGTVWGLAERAEIRRKVLGRLGSGMGLGIQRNVTEVGSEKMAGELAVFPRNPRGWPRGREVPMKIPRVAGIVRKSSGKGVVVSVVPTVRGMRDRTCHEIVEENLRTAVRGKGRDGRIPGVDRIGGDVEAVSGKVDRNRLQEVVRAIGTADDEAAGSGGHPQDDFRIPDDSGGLENEIAPVSHEFEERAVDDEIARRVDVGDLDAGESEPGPPGTGRGQDLFMVDRSADRHGTGFDPDAAGGIGLEERASDLRGAGNEIGVPKHHVPRSVPGIVEVRIRDSERLPVFAGTDEQGPRGRTGSVLGTGIGAFGKKRERDRISEIVERTPASGPDFENLSVGREPTGMRVRVFDGSFDGDFQRPERPFRHERDSFGIVSSAAIDRSVRVLRRLRTRSGNSYFRLRPTSRDGERRDCHERCALGNVHIHDSEKKNYSALGPIPHPTKDS